MSSDCVEIRLTYGLTEAQLRVAREQLLCAENDGPQEAEPVADVQAAVREALESPIDFPPLRLALTPSDRLAIVIDEQFRRLPDLLIPILEHVQQAGLSLSQVKLLCPPRVPGIAPPPWREELPPALAAVELEEHVPDNRSRLAYLAGTQGGRRLYLNRTLVEADQILVAGPAHYDPVLGYGGGLGDLFPSLADTPTRQEFSRRVIEGPPGQLPNPARREVEEVGWLIGVPFWVAAVPGRGDNVRAIRAGPAASISSQVYQLLDAEFSWRFPWRAETVVTTVSGDPRWHRLEDLTRALAAAARVVQQGGKIIALSQVGPESIGPAAQKLAEFENLIAALSHARHHHLEDAHCLWHLAVASQRAQIYLFGNLPTDFVESMDATALQSLREIQRILDHAESCIFLPDGHRANVCIGGSQRAIK